MLHKVKISQWSPIYKAICSCGWTDFSANRNLLAANAEDHVSGQIAIAVGHRDADIEGGTVHLTFLETE